MKIKKISLQYLKYFANKNINQISDLLDNNVSLTDWEICVEGKSQVVNAFKKIFESVTNIKVYVKKSYCIDNVFIGEIDIEIDNSKILVVDIITFNSDFKISSIRAYKG